MSSGARSPVGTLLLIFLLDGQETVIIEDVVLASSLSGYFALLYYSFVAFQ